MAELLPRIYLEDMDFTYWYDDERGCCVGVCKWHHPYKDVIVTSDLFPLELIDNDFPDEIVKRKKLELQSSIMEKPTMIYDR